MRWNLTGTVKQQTIAREAFEPVQEPAPYTPLFPEAFKHFPDSGEGIYHKWRHYGQSRGVELKTFEGFRACKVCKP